MIRGNREHIRAPHGHPQASRQDGYHDGEAEGADYEGPRCSCLEALRLELLLRVLTYVFYVHLLCHPRALTTMEEQAAQLMSLHDELAEIKSEHSGSQTPSAEPLDLRIAEGYFI